jgi:hypothetical protein
MKPPVHRFTPESASLSPVPPRWEYPPGLEMRRVHHNGVIGHANQLYFVSEALRGEDVRVCPSRTASWSGIGHMYVREFHLRARRSMPLLNRSGIVADRCDTIRRRQHVSDVLTFDVSTIS